MFGVRISPPNGSIHPKPMSSITMYSTFGAPSGASGGIGNAGSESSNVRPIRPGNRSPSRYVFIRRQPPVQDEVIRDRSRRASAQPARVHWPVRIAPRWWQGSLPPIGVSVRVEPLPVQE